MRRMFYSGKLMLSGYLYGAFILLFGLLFILVNMESWEIAQANVASIITILMIGLPLFNILLFTNLFAEDMEERALDLVFTYPHRAHYLLLERIVFALIIATIAFGLSLLTAHFTLLHLSYENLWEITKRVVPVNAYLSGLSLLLSLIGRNVLIGLGAGISYWLLELMTMGKWTRALHLFQGIWPTQAVTLDNNGLFLLFGSMGWLAGSIILFTVGKRRMISNLL
ncbi:hypothetical protein [Cohnella sp. WQ 127256]|uniref:hypothetical protein n=1 Tax=Cohnella sp. WQ 127256 TaxID=2938790 RepID=UPI0021181BDC|nr:hypothetical protein [Cohnella sp. WQ 127256]